MAILSFSQRGVITTRDDTEANKDATPAMAMVIGLSVGFSLFLAGVCIVLVCWLAKRRRTTRLQHAADQPISFQAHPYTEMIANTLLQPSSVCGADGRWSSAGPSQLRSTQEKERLDPGASAGLPVNDANAMTQSLRRASPLRYPHETRPGLPANPAAYKSPSRTGTSKLAVESKSHYTKSIPPRSRSGSRAPSPPWSPRTFLHNESTSIHTTIRPSPVVSRATVKTSMSSMTQAPTSRELVITQEQYQQQCREKSPLGISSFAEHRQAMGDSKGPRYKKLRISVASTNARNNMVKEIPVRSGKAILFG